MNKTDYDYLLSSVTSIPDFPKPGIIFRDITSLIEDPRGLHIAVSSLADYYRDAGFTKIMAAEARGFVFGSAVAYELQAGLVLVRKPGKLPRDAYSVDYALEYGTGTVQCHKDSIQVGDKILIVDDLLATGGTALAMMKLAKQAGATVTDAGFVISLPELQGRERLKEQGIKTFSLIDFTGA